MADPIKIDINRHTASVTLRVQFVGERRLAVRIWIARLLIRLAAWIVGMNVKIEEKVTSG